MRTLLAAGYGRGSLLFLSALAAAYAQNPVTVTPNPVFLNATVNGGPVQALVTVNSTTGSAGVAFAAPTVPWLTLAALTFNTPANIPFTGNPAGLAAGVYNTSVALTTPGGAIPVQVIMTVNSAAPALTLSPASLIFNYTQGGALPSTQALSVVSNSSVLGYTASVSANWLTFSTATGQASPGIPGTVAIGVNPAALAGPGAYVGTVTITPAIGDPTQVPVLFNFAGGAQFIPSVSSVAFSLQSNSTTNVVQKTIAITSSGPPINFAAVGSSITSSGGIQWLAVSPLISTTPATLTVTATAAGLPSGQYQGSVNIAATDSSGASVKIPVTLTVSSQPLLDVNPASLSFSYQAGGPAPAHQSVTPTTTTPGQFYTIAVSTNGTGNWLNVAASGVTPAPVDVGIDPTGLATGTYTGSITFNAPGAGNSPQTVTVTLAVTNNPTLTSPNAAGLTFNFEIGQGQPGPQTVSVSSSSGGPLNFSLAATQNNTSNNIIWLVAGSPSSNVTPATLNVTVNPNGMAAGRYTGAIVMTSPGGNPLSIPVTLNVSNLGSPLISVNPQSLTFNSTPGGAVNPQSVTVLSTGESVAYSLTSSVASPFGPTWLVLTAPGGPASAATPSVFFASAQPTGLAAGTYTANITVQPSNGNPAVVIPVTLNVGATNLSVSPGSLTFTQNFGGPAPPQQNLNVASSGGAVPFNVVASGGTWLTVAPANGTTPATLGVSVNGAGLTPGNYSGQIVVTAVGAANGQTIAVNLTIAPQSLTVSTNSLIFNSVAGSPTPAPQAVTLTAPVGSLPFTAATNVSSPAGGNWLSVSPASGIATASPTSLTVAVNSQGLSAGTYSGSVTVSSPNVPNSSQIVNVTFVVNSIPTPILGTIVNGASFQPGAIAPGEIITISGTNLGPATGVSNQAPPGTLLPTLLAGTQVTFDGTPAPLLYVSATQINVVAPYAIANRVQTQLAVVYNNASSAAVALNVTSSAPAIFVITAPGFPSTQGAILNQNTSINSPNNPARRGSVIVIYATGEGATNPPGVDGLVIPADPNTLKHPLLPVQVTIGGYPADIQYAGSAPGFVSGALQINAVVPDATGSGSVPVVVTAGTNSSPGGVTVAVQ